MTTSAGFASGSDDQLPLPADNHVHTQFSWDAENGSMESACRRATEIGLPSVAFTEHIDRPGWVIHDERVAAAGEIAPHLDAHNHFHAPPFDVDGYFAEIDRCRSLFPSLRILTGLELGEPHWFPQETAELLRSGTFDRVLGSLHSTRVDDEPRLIDEWYAQTGDSDHPLSPEHDGDAVRSYLAEAIDLVNQSDVFEVFAHIDYVTRQIRGQGRVHNPLDFEAEYRETLRAVQGAGRILEINTRLPLDVQIIRWWHEEGGAAVSFGSDAHEGGLVGNGFQNAAEMAVSAGFQPQADPLDFWRRG